MGLLDNQTQRQYYDGKKISFTGDGTTQTFTIANSVDTFPTTYDFTNVKIYFDGVAQLAQTHDGTSQPLVNNWTFSYDSNGPKIDGWRVYFKVAPTNGTTIDIYVDNDFGNYQFISLASIINNFMATYIGEGKILTDTKRNDVSFHAHRALAELSFDTFKSTKSQEITLPPSLTMILPQDYVNYAKLSWVDSSGVKRVLYPASKTSNPSNPLQDANGDFDFAPWSITDSTRGDDSDELIPGEQSDAWSNYKSTTPSENNNDDYIDDTYWPAGGERYGLDPQHAQINGSFFIDELKGRIHFSSNISGKTVILDYISDSLGDDTEMQVHKFAEEAIYKHIMYGCISAKLNVPEYIINRFRRERFAETRKAKLRLSNIKIEEITQILRGKSKQIKH
jgi:hypothetical protein